MRGWSIVATIALAVGCGTARESGPPRAAPAPSAIPPDPGPPAAEAPRGDPNACEASVECTFSSFPWVETEADCACPECDVEAVSLARLAEIAARHREVCGEWLRAHDCPQPMCDVGSRLSLCVGGRCLAESVVESGRGLRSPCASPADCAGRAACVTAALGGPIGCTNEVCCGTDECGNGCVDASDCPACRPLCVAGGCRRESGP